MLLDAMVHNDIIAEIENPADPLGLVKGPLKPLDVEAVTITAEDKRKFQDCLIDNTRFTKTFTFFNGKVTATYRNRKNNETRAILVEITKYASDNKLSVMEHSAKLRHALLHFQLAELNGVERPEVEAPLKSIETFDKNTGKVVIVPPKWIEHMDAVFDGMSEGLTNVLYNGLRTFEKIYWSMVNSAKDQNFWNPEDSIID